MQISTVNHPLKKFLRFGIYSEPKYGKTRLSTSLPWGDFWGNYATYVAWDPGSDSPDVVLPHNREHLVIAQPTTYEKGGKKFWDPHKEAITLATKPWAIGFTEGDVVIPPCGTLIWDTMTATARDLLAAYADSGVFQGEKGDKHVSVGDFGTPSYMAQPMMGDYGIAQRAILHILGFLFKQPMHLIVLFHTDYIEPEGAGQVTFGPAVVGKSAIKSVASMFDNLFRLDVVTRPVPGKAPSSIQKHVVVTQKRGLYLGGMRSPHPTNPLPEVELGGDPVTFWQQIETILKGDK